MITTDIEISLIAQGYIARRDPFRQRIVSLGGSYQGRNSVQNNNFLARIETLGENFPTARQAPTFSGHIPVFSK